MLTRSMMKSPLAFRISATMSKSRKGMTLVTNSAFSLIAMAATSGSSAAISSQRNPWFSFTAMAICPASRSASTSTSISGSSFIAWATSTGSRVPTKFTNTSLVLKIFPIKGPRGLSAGKVITAPPATSASSPTMTMTLMTFCTFLLISIFFSP